jgi:hypothetical protein
VQTATNIESVTSTSSGAAKSGVSISSKIGVETTPQQQFVCGLLGVKIEAFDNTSFMPGSLFWLGDRLTILFNSTEGEGGFGCFIERRRDREKVFLQTEHLEFSYRYKGASEEKQKTVMTIIRRLAGRLNKYNIIRIKKLLEAYKLVDPYVEGALVQQEVEMVVSGLDASSFGAQSWYQFSRNIRAITIPEGKHVVLLSGTSVRLNEKREAEYVVQADPGDCFRLSLCDGNMVGEDVSAEDLLKNVDSEKSLSFELLKSRVEVRALVSQEMIWLEEGASVRSVLEDDIYTVLEDGNKELYLLDKMDAHSLEGLLFEVSDEVKNIASAVALDIRNGVHESWGHDERWRLFFAHSEIKRGRDSVMQIDLPWVSIEHGEHECQHVGVGDFVNYPWKSPWRSKRKEHEGQDTQKRGEQQLQGHYVTTLDDMDIIDGGVGKIKKLLNILQNESVKPEIVSINCTCTPMMIGDDLDSLIEEQRAETDYTILYKDQKQNVSPYGRHIDTMVERLKASEPAEKNDSAVNLVGFWDGAALDEITRQLEDLGVCVNTQTVPRMNLEMMDRYKVAKVQVICENDEWRQMYDYITGHLDLETLRVIAPFGIDFTRKFFESILGSLGKDDALVAFNGTVNRIIEERWEPLTRIAETLGVGIVLDSIQLNRIKNPADMFSVPIIQLLEEMGFTLHFAYFETNEQSDDELKTQFQDIVKRPDKHCYTRFGAEEELDSWFRADGFQTVFSDYTYDSRIISRGKTPISANTFEMGIMGAVRTLERVIRHCQLNFYKKYALYL